MKFISQIFFKGLYYFIVDKNFRKFVWLVVRYANAKRHHTREIGLFGSRLMVADCKSFIWQYYDIFFKRYYHFNSQSPKPVIIDCGANIGLSVINFKRQYPDAELHVFEPDNKIFDLLSRNVASYGLKNVYLYNQAVWVRNELLSFESDGADGGHLSSDSSVKEKVKAIDFASFLGQFEHVDFLKIDIEGAESKLLPHISEYLDKVEHIFVEFHSFNDQPDQCLAEVIQALASKGHRIYIDSINFKNEPFIHRKGKYGMDLQLNIFAYKP